MAREVNFNKWYWVILNPLGFVGQKFKNETGGDAYERVQTWIKSDINNIPLRCGTNELGGCTFNGTAADFESYRQQWILKCKTANKTSILHSNNKAINECEAIFDEYTKDIQLAQYAENASSYADIKEKISANQNTIILLIAALIFAGLIIYLLTS